MCCSNSKVPLELCDYMVDSDFPLRYTGNELSDDACEPRYAVSEEWLKITCVRFLDASHSGLFGRSFWLPLMSFDRSSWGEFCMLRRKR